MVKNIVQSSGNIREIELIRLGWIRLSVVDYRDIDRLNNMVQNGQDVIHNSAFYDTHYCEIINGRDGDTGYDSAIYRSGARPESGDR